ncbi:MAG: hypothetical protein WDN69_05515 [Aliidongia sp.]
MATHFDATLMQPTRFSLGFMKSMGQSAAAAGRRFRHPGPARLRPCRRRRLDRLCRS